MISSRWNMIDRVIARYEFVDRGQRHQASVTGLTCSTKVLSEFYSCCSNLKAQHFFLVPAQSCILADILFSTVRAGPADNSTIQLSSRSLIPREEARQ